MDEQLCNQIIEKHGDMVLRLAYNQTKNKTEAEDVFQEVFMRLIKNYEKIQDAEHCKAWLIRTTINCSKSIFLSGYYKHTTELEYESGKEDEHKSEVYYAVMALPKKYRSVVYLFYYEGYSIQEIASLLKKNENTIKTHLSRARDQLKTMLKGEWAHV